MVNTVSGSSQKVAECHLNLTKYHLDTQKVKTVQKLQHREPNKKYCLGTVGNIKLLGGLKQVKWDPNYSVTCSVRMVNV